MHEPTLAAQQGGGRDVRECSRTTSVKTAGLIRLPVGYCQNKSLLASLNIVNRFFDRSSRRFDVSVLTIKVIQCTHCCVALTFKLFLLASGMDLRWET